MLKRVLVLLILSSTGFGCALEDGGEMYRPTILPPERRQILERFKRELVQIEDIRISTGAVAAWGRKVMAEIDVRYANGAVVYQGTSISYQGMQGDVFIHNNLRGNGLLSLQQMGIMLGLNGMVVGGKRRITVSPGLVCFTGRIEDASNRDNPSVSCPLVRQSQLQHGYVEVRQETLIIEATLTASCTPIFLHIPMLYSGELYCRDSNDPRHDPNAPIWRLD